MLTLEASWIASELSLSIFIRRVCLLQVALVFLPAIACGDDPPRPRFTVSPKTTFVQGPLRADGSVDFVAAINQRLGEGIPSGSNSCIPLFQANGPTLGLAGFELPGSFFDRLGMARPLGGTTYLQSFEERIDALGLSEKEEDRFHEQLFMALSRPWTAKEFPEVAEWLDQNRSPLHHVKIAASRDQYFLPLFTSEEPHPEPLVALLAPALSASETAGQLLRARAMLDVTGGDPAAGWKGLMASYRLGRLVGRGPFLQADGLQGCRLERQSHDAIVSLLQRLSLTSEEVKACQDLLAGMPPMWRVRDKVQLVERCICLDALLVMAWNRKKAVTLLGVEEGLDAAARIVSLVRDLGVKSIDWDMALGSANAWYDRLVRNLDEPDYRVRLKKLRQMEQQLGRLADRFRKPERTEGLRDPERRDQVVGQMMGDAVAALLIPRILQSQAIAISAQQQTRNLQVAFALAAYRADHKAFPDRLELLVPAYLEEVPLDLFTAGLPVYRLVDDGYLLYSCGPDGRDNQGRTAKDQLVGDDLPIRITLGRR